MGMQTSRPYCLQFWRMLGVQSTADKAHLLLTAGYSRLSADVRIIKITADLFSRLFLQKTKDGFIETILLFMK